MYKRKEKVYRINTKTFLILKSFQYHAKHIVIATCKSSRNLETVCRFIRKVYKIKRSNQTDQRKKLKQVPTIDGLKAKSSWLVFDMGT